MRGLKEKVALVTGGASGLGKAIAERLSAESATVVITDVQRALGQETAAAGAITFIEQDVSVEQQWNKVIQEVEARFGRLDILVNNAGIVGPMNAATPEGTTLADWQRIFAVNVEGVFLGCKAGIAAMRRSGGGVIINISSIAGLLAVPGATAYSTSKAAVRHLTKTVAQYCAQERLNIRCNSVHPGNVRTPALERAYRDIASARGISIEQAFKDAQERIPLGDLQGPDDIAAAVAFLASDDARCITGELLTVDGGLVNCDTYRHSANQGSDARQLRNSGS